MSVRTFRAPTVPAALARVRREMGGEAVILETREVSARPPIVEVIARADDGESEADGPERAPMPERAVDTVDIRSSRTDADLAGTTERATSASAAPLQTEVGVAVADVPERDRAPESTPSAPRAVAGSPRSGLLDELAALRSRLDRMNGWLLADTPPEFDDEAKRLHVRLVETGVDPRLAAALLRRASSATGDRARAVWDALADAVPIRSEPPSGSKRVVTLVGPTGVGKTTTCAKLAARAVLTEGRTAALVTTDDRRVGAAAPLSFYADVLDVPFACVHDVGELKRVLRALSDVELVIVDTAGRTARDERDVRSLDPWLSAAPEIEPWLVLAAPTTASTNLDLLRAFESVEPEAVVVSKVDEATRPGEVANVLIRGHLPLAFLTSGPRVPDDIEVATRASVPRLLLDPGAA